MDAIRRRFIHHRAGSCDNLSAECSISDIAAETLEARLCGDRTVGVFTLDDPPGEGGDHWYLRTTFETGPPATAAGHTVPPNAVYRTRLSLRYDAAEARLAHGKPVRVAVERRWGDVGALNQVRRKRIATHTIS